MPFTAAHPAAILPLHRWTRLPLSALVIGSLAPDFAYFVPLPISRSESHELGALLWFCLPFGLAACLTFHAILQRPLVLLLPSPLRRRLWPSAADSSLPPGGLQAVALAIVLGAMTHLAWDSFTHGDGWIVRRAPALQVHLATLGGYEVFVFKVLQHGSTIVGAGVLAIASGLSLRSARSVDDPSHRLPPFVRGAVWLSCGLAAAAVALARSAEVVQPPFDLAMLQRALGRAVVPSIGTALALLLLYCLAWQLVERARPEWTS